MACSPPVMAWQLSSLTLCPSWTVGPCACRLPLCLFLESRLRRLELARRQHPHLGRLACHFLGFGLLLCEPSGLLRLQLSRRLAPRPLLLRRGRRLSALRLPQLLAQLVDNRDGTMSIFVIALDHAAPPAWTPGDLSQVGLASLSRELSANAWLNKPALLAGSPLDRNVELLMPTPFELSTISDGVLEAEQMKSRAQALAHGGGA